MKRRKWQHLRIVDTLKFIFGKTLLLMYILCGITDMSLAELGSDMSELK